MTHDDDHTRLSDGSEEPTLLVSGEQATMLSPLSQSGSSPVPAVSLTEGQTFGPYRIGRMLGRGGMGEVYEAEHHDTGRRVALKLLRGRMDRGEDRERFLREGRLAASVSDPHTVYVFGSEEIDRMPVISMQLVPGGTLKDRVASHGPMPVVEAVSAIIDIISGLDAAASAGILHRDIKPSNCFVDADGNVKVGDFGLSIPSSGRAAEGAFMGTPQFASPEQLRGEALDVRSDIYAVGATLHYLLTGAAPFDGKDVTTLIDRVKHDPPPLAHKLRAGVPAALGKVITRCLAKDAQDRPASYQDLARQLRPFSATGQPARLDVRALAGAIDLLLISVPAGLIDAAFGLPRLQRGSSSVDLDPWSVVLAVVYFAICEAVWNGTPGKRLLGLRVVSRAGALTWKQAWGRALIFYAPTMVMQLPLVIFGSEAVLDYLVRHPFVAAAGGLSQGVLTMALFATMRRRNGYGALHDLLTNSRVVRQRSRELRRRDPEQATTVASDTPSNTAHRRLGPFVVGRELATLEHGRLLEGVDAVLRRSVWLVECDDAGPETPRARRDVDRIGRLHWLAGRRAPGDNWDAFEAPQGLPLAALATTAGWNTVHGWLNDLVAELTAAERDGTVPGLALDRVWIRPDGRAVLLDWPAPGVEASPTLSPQQLLTTVGRRALSDADEASMPASAVAMLDRWQKKRSLTLADVAADLALVTTSATGVSRTRRLGPLLVGASPLLLMMFASVIAMSSQVVVPHDRFVTTELLEDLVDEKDPSRQEAMRVYLAATYRTELLTPDARWRSTDDDDPELARMRTVADEAAALAPTPEQVTDARATLGPALTRLEERAGDQDQSTTIFIALLLVGAGMSLSGGLVSVTMRPSGLVMSSIGLAVVTRGGREVGRLRAMARLLVAWSPLLVYGALLAWPVTREAVHSIPIAVAFAAPVVIGFVWTALRPARGPHDMIVGTSIGTR